MMSHGCVPRFVPHLRPLKWTLWIAIKLRGRRIACDFNDQTRHSELMSGKEAPSITKCVTPIYLLKEGYWYCIDRWHYSKERHGVLPQMPRYDICVLPAVPSSQRCKNNSKFETNTSIWGFKHNNRVGLSSQLEPSNVFILNPLLRQASVTISTDAYMKISPSNMTPHVRRARDSLLQMYTAGSVNGCTLWNVSTISV
jgi:hypothetical protein